MQPANYSTIYTAMGIYPQLAEITRSHGYALAVHGSLGKDMDLTCIPWVEEVSDPEVVVDEIVSKFALERRGDSDVTHHGRIRIPLGVSFDDCFIDLSFMPIIKK